MSSVNNEILKYLELPSYTSFDGGYFDHHEYVIHEIWHDLYYDMNKIYFRTENDLKKLLANKANKSNSTFLIYKIIDTDPLELKEISYNYSVELVE